MGEVRVSLLPNIPMVFQTVLTMNFKRYMVEQIIDRDGDVVYKHEARFLFVFTLQQQQRLCGSLARGYYVWATTF